MGIVDVRVWHGAPANTAICIGEHIVAIDIRSANCSSGCDIVNTVGGDFRQTTKSGEFNLVAIA